MTLPHLRRPHELTAADFPVPIRKFAADYAEIADLVGLCADGKLYEVERWIEAGKPLQAPPSDDRKLRKRAMPLFFAVRNRNHSLAGLLLANGYDPNGDAYERLTYAATDRNLSMVDLLLRFGADPRAVDFAEVLLVCDAQIEDRLIEGGVDPAHRNATAVALESKRRPVLGFVKRYRERIPSLQRQVDIALHGFVDRDDEKGVALMVWLGGDPHASTPSSIHPLEWDHEDDGTAFRSASYGGRFGLLKYLIKAPIPSDQVSVLFRSAASAGSPVLVKRLLALGGNPNEVEDGRTLVEDFINTVIWSRWHGSPPEYNRGTLDALEVILRAGANWDIDEPALRDLRRKIIRSKDPETAKALVRLLKEHPPFPAFVVSELIRTPAVSAML